jgi:AraC family transcriptional regulator
MLTETNFELRRSPAAFAGHLAIAPADPQTTPLVRQLAERRCGALPKWRIRRLEEFLVANIDKRVSLDDMATAVGLSKMHFAAQFRVATGFRPREYLLLKRIERAKAMMTASRMPLVEVAFAVGFNAQAHFSTVFKRFTGKSPAQWKQEFQFAG